jgi:hypothetical protein
MKMREYWSDFHIKLSAFNDDIMQSHQTLSALTSSLNIDTYRIEMRMFAIVNSSIYIMFV